MRDIGIPSGLAEVGYGGGDIDGLVAGTLQQERLLSLAPRRPTGGELHRILLGSLHNW